MTRYNEKWGITPDSMDAYAKSLADMAEAHQALANSMREKKLPEVRATHLKSALSGMGDLAKFLGAVMTAYSREVGIAGIAAIDPELAREELQGGVLSPKEAKSLKSAKDIATNHSVSKKGK